MRLNDRSYGTLPPRPGNNRVLRELTLSLTGLYGAKACVTDASAHLESFYLIYGGDAGITPSRGHRFVEVDLVRSSGAPTLASCYLVEVLHAAYNCSTEKLIVENVHQFIVLAVVAAQEADALLDTSSEPLLRVPLEAILSDIPAPTPLLCDVRAHQLTVPGTVTAPSTDAVQRLPLPPCLIPSSAICATTQSRHATNRWPLWPSLHSAPVELLSPNDKELISARVS